MIRFTLALLSAMNCATGYAAEEEKYRFGDQQVAFISLEGGELLVTENCAPKPKGSACDALKRAAKATTSKLNLNGGANPGALICTKIEGKVRIGRDSKQNEQAFCAFPDSSMIAADSLLNRAIQNDLGKK